MVGISRYTPSDATLLYALVHCLRYTQARVLITGNQNWGIPAATLNVGQTILYVYPTGAQDTGVVD